MGPTNVQPAPFPCAAFPEWHGLIDAQAMHTSPAEQPFSSNRQTCKSVCGLSNHAAEGSAMGGASALHSDHTHLCVRPIITKTEEMMNM